MRRYILRRLAQLVPSLLLITFMVFALMHALPGDPARALVSGGEALDETQLAVVRHELNLDRPMPVQYALWLGKALSLDLGRGGVSRLSQVTGMSRMTITKAIKELRGRGALQPAAMGRIRHQGAGRKRIEESAPEVTKLIAAIVEETTAGDPMSLLRWTSKSTRTIADELARRGHPIDASTVGRYLGILANSAT